MESQVKIIKTTQRQKDVKTEGQKDGETERRRDGETERQKDGKTERQVCDRQEVLLRYCWADPQASSSCRKQTIFENKSLPTSTIV